MNFPRREIVENLRKEYPSGTRGTVLRVDDTGSLLMRWDTGSGLTVVYGEDVVRKISE